MPRGSIEQELRSIALFAALATLSALGSSACALSRSGEDDPPPNQPEGRVTQPEVGVTQPEGRVSEPDPVDARPQVPAITAHSSPTADLASSTIDPSAASDPSPELGDVPPIAEPEEPVPTVEPADPTAIAPELQPLERPRWIKHRRAPRETLRQVAIRYGTSESKVREWNGLGPSDPLPPRKKRLRVWARRMPPPREHVEYTVQEGDTWWSVSLRHGVEPRDLRVYNWPWKKKMQPGTTLDVWIDPLVFEWISAGPDPFPADLDHQYRRGAISIGSPNDGVLVNGLRIPEVEGIHLRLPKTAYGTSHAVEQLLLALDRFRQRTSYPADIDVGIGSMSASRGGRIGTHLSHQSGRDVDIKLLRRPDVSPWREIKGSRVEWTAVWDMVQAFSEGDVLVIFLDQRAQRRLFRAATEAGATPEQLAAARRLVQHSPGHEHHLHVRFRCGPFEPECIP